MHLDEQHIGDRRQYAQDLDDEETVVRVRNAVRALSQLSAPLRETSRLSYLSEYSHQQVADRLRIPLGTVKRRLWESRKQMKKEVVKMSQSQKQIKKELLDNIDFISHFWQDPADLGYSLLHLNIKEIEYLKIGEMIANKYECDL